MMISVDVTAGGALMGSPSIQLRPCWKRWLLTTITGQVREPPTWWEVENTMSMP